jgi:hypothetical protein
MTSVKPSLVNVALPVTITATQQTTLQITGIQPQFMTASYTSPNGNNPVSMSNNLFVWLSQGFGTGIPWGQAAIGTTAATPNNTAISPTSGRYSANPYCLGYSVGPSVTSAGTTTYPNICATAEIDSNWDVNNLKTFSSSLGIAGAQTAYITFTYAVPPGANPGANGAWIGFWYSPVVPYNNQPDKATPITYGNSNGQVPMLGLGLAPNSQYTAALFTSGYSATPASLNLTTIAAVIQFTTGDSLVAAP